NQVSHLIARLEGHRFGDIEVEELLLRPYKPVAARLRPADTMVGHTGYLIFARKVEMEEIVDEEPLAENLQAQPEEKPPAE
ncbi:MAG: tRNA (adenine-N1)-methyltransferase, partial [bacterium]